MPKPFYSLEEEIDRYHESQPSEPRHHLGCSQIGGPCQRRLWYEFHEGIRESFSGRMLRLFRRGRMEEDLVVSDLLAAGHTVEDRQRRVDFGHGFSGSIDGILDGKAVLEIKTHNEKSFNDLLRKGVKKSKPQHWVQMQCYMLGTGLDRAVYFAVNKNTDEIYTERVYFDKAAAEDAVRMAHDIILGPVPGRITGDPEWWECRFCPARGRCWS